MLEVIPPQFARLVLLERLDLSGNLLRRPPKVIDQLPELIVVKLSRNFIQKVHMRHPRIEQLILDMNFITNIQVDLPRLTYLSLENNEPDVKVM